MAVMSYREGNRVRWVGTRPGHDGTQVLVWKAAVNATEVLYAVPAGKILYLTHMAIHVESDIAGSGYMHIRDGGGITQYFGIAVKNIVGGSFCSNSESFWPPIEMPASWDVAVVSSIAALIVIGSIHGWYEPPP